MFRNHHTVSNNLEAATTKELPVDTRQVVCNQLSAGHYRNDTIMYRSDAIHFAWQQAPGVPLTISLTTMC